MHLFDRATRFYGGNAIVGGGLPLAVGLALGDKMQGSDRADRLLLRRGRGRRGRVPRVPEPGARCGACRCCSCARTTSTPWARALERAEAQTDIHAKAKGYRIPSEVVDGMDVVAVEAAARRGGRADPGRQRPLLPRVPHLPLSRALDVRRRSSTGRRTRSRPGSANGPIVRFQGWLDEAGLLHADELERDRGRGRSRGRGRGRLRRGRQRWSRSRSSSASY